MEKPEEYDIDKDMQNDEDVDENKIGKKVTGKSEKLVYFIFETLKIQLNTFSQTKVNTVWCAGCLVNAEQLVRAVCICAYSTLRLFMPI